MQPDPKSGFGVVFFPQRVETDGRLERNREREHDFLNLHLWIQRLCRSFSPLDTPRHVPWSIMHFPLNFTLISTTENQGSCWQSLNLYEYLSQRDCCPIFTNCVTISLNSKHSDLFIFHSICQRTSKSQLTWNIYIIFICELYMVVKLDFFGEGVGDYELNVNVSMLINDAKMLLLHTHNIYPQVLHSPGLNLSWTC